MKKHYNMRKIPFQCFKTSYKGLDLTYLISYNLTQELTFLSAKKMKKLIIILIIVISLLGLSAWGFFYLKNTFVPKILKNLIEESVKNNTDLKIRIGNITYELGKGVIIENVALFENTPSAKEVLSVKKITFNVLLLPSLKGKQIIIPALYLKQPRLTIGRSSDKIWNLENYLKKNINPSKNPAPRIVVLKIDASSGWLRFEDAGISPVLTKELSNLNLQVNPANLKDITFKFTSNISDNLAKKAKVSAQGNYNLERQTLKAICQLENLNLAEFSGYYIIPDLKLNSLAIQTLKSDFKYSFASQELSLTSQLELNNFDLKNKGVVLQGKAKLNITTYITSLLDKPNLKNLSASLEFSDSNVSGLEKIDSLKKIKSKINIKNNLLTLDSFDCLWFDSYVKAKAKIPLEIIQETNREKRPALIDLSGEKLDIEKLISFLPDNLSKSIESASGEMDLKAHIELDEIKRQENPRFNINANLRNASLKLTNFDKEISSINADVSAENNSLEWKNLTFFIAPYKDFSSSGSLKNFAQPKIRFSLSNPLLEVKASLLSKTDKLEIESLGLDSLDSWAKINGSINLANQDKPSLDINMEARLNLSNLSKWLPDMEEKIKQSNPRGIIGLKTKINGPIKRLGDCAITLAADSESLKVNNLTLTNLKLAGNQADNLINNLVLTADAYGGKLRIDTTGQVYAKNFNLDINGQIQDMSLEKFKTDLGLKNQEMSGDINSNFKLNVRNPIKDNITGNGKIEIKNGNIWQMRPFEGLAQLLVIREFSKINFKEGYAVFSIKNNRIYTQDMALTNPQMNLLAVGSLGFDGSLDFTVNCKFSEEYLKHSSDLRKTITGFFTQMQEYATIQVSGNVKNPEYTIIPAKIGIDFLKPLKDILESPQ